ncbi:unnamed protein product [Rangifer tarandus platyrhynchus]|uniref:Uncharacterized protein n=1 Tax=Rangifer tarandus platyrhynchus TaxID=3082113 RepID=A0ABN8ZPK4_RANTA|nr:unnamed protein product [Rangifer tarandus platyrhynchus]
MGSPPNREGLRLRRPSPPRPVPASVGFLFCALPLPPPSGFPRHDPRLWRSCLLEFPERQEPRSVLIRMGSTEFRLRQAPSPL